MSKQITKDDVIKLAQLAKLQLTDDEIEAYTKDLSGIFEYINMLSDIDTEGLEPTSQVTGLTNVMRADVVAQNQVAPPEDLLAGAPESEDGYVKVKRMI